MGDRRGSCEVYHRHRGPDLPNRTQNRETFQQSVPYPSGTEQEFARRHAEIFGDAENMIDEQHVDSPHFPRRSERARMHGVYTTSNQLRDRTRDAYNAELEAAVAEFDGLGDDQAQYYSHTSDGMLPRRHAALLPLARAREEPNFQ